MTKPVQRVRSKKVGRYRLRLTTHQPDDRGGMIELLDTEFDGKVIYEGHYEHGSNAVEQYRELRTGKQAIDWAWRNS